MGVSLRGVSLFVSRMILPSFISFYTFVLGGGVPPCLRHWNDLQGGRDYNT